MGDYYVDGVKLQGGPSGRGQAFVDIEICLLLHSKCSIGTIGQPAYGTTLVIGYCDYLGKIVTISNICHKVSKQMVTISDNQCNLKILTKSWN